MKIPCSLHRLLIDLYYLFFRVLSFLFFFLRVKNKIVFNNFNGRGFGENPQYIAQEIIRQGLKYDLVWLVSDMNSTMPCEIRKVKIDTIRAAYELATARVIINNVKNYLPYKKKKEQYYIQTWHGELPFKLIEGECADRLEKKYLKESKEDSKKIDLLLSGCALDTSIYKNSFWYNGEILEKGLPKYDMLFETSKERIEGIRKFLNIKDHHKVALYAPTFRDDGCFEAYYLDINALLKCLVDKTGSKWVIIIRMHPNASSFSNSYNYSDTIINGSLVSDPQELVLISDLLVTDYSSFMIDFMISSKPIVIYANDLETYEKQRGLRPFYYQLPFVKAKNNKDLVDNIKNLDIDFYKSKEAEFVKECVRSFDNGHASECVVERIKKIMSKE